MRRKQLSLVVLLGITVAQVIGFNVYAINKVQIHHIPKAAIAKVIFVDAVNDDSSISVKTISPSEPETPEFIPYDVPLSSEIQDYIYQKCVEMDIPFELVLAIIKCESNFEVDGISETDDYGLMQINECNHEWLSEELGITDFLDAKQNIDAGMFILDDLFDKETDLSKVLMMYNCGPTGAQRLWDKGIYSTSYARKVMSQMETLERR